MKTIILILTLISVQLIIAQESQLVVNNQQKLTWKGEAAFGGYAPEGALDIKKATINMNEDVIISLTVVIDMTSIQQENKQLEGHLRDRDFFHVKKYPTATFVSEIVIQKSKDTYIVKGKMTIKETQLSEDIEITLFRKGENLELSFNHSMDRTKYGITYNSPSFFKKLKENAIADSFLIKGVLVFEKPEFH